MQSPQFPNDSLSDNISAISLYSDMVILYFFNISFDGFGYVKNCISEHPSSSKSNTEQSFLIPKSSSSASIELILNVSVAAITILYF